MQKGCELFVEKFLPRIKASIAQILVKQYGSTQKDAAKALNISQTTISLCLNKNRAFIKLHKAQLESIAKKILDNEEYLSELCALCHKLNVKCAAKNM